MAPPKTRSDALGQKPAPVKSPSSKVTKLKAGRQQTAIKAATAVKNATKASTDSTRIACELPEPFEGPCAEQDQRMEAEAPAEAENTCQTPVVVNDNPEVADEGWTEVVSKDTQRRVLNAKKALDDLRTRIEKKVCSVCSWRKEQKESRMDPQSSRTLLSRMAFSLCVRKSSENFPSPDLSPETGKSKCGRIQLKRPRKS